MSSEIATEKLATPPLPTQGARAPSPISSVSNPSPTESLQDLRQIEREHQATVETIAKLKGNGATVTVSAGITGLGGRDVAQVWRAQKSDVMPYVNSNPSRQLRENGGELLHTETALTTPREATFTPFYARTTQREDGTTTLRVYDVLAPRESRLVREYQWSTPPNGETIRNVSAELRQELEQRRQAHELTLAGIQPKSLSNEEIVFQTRNLSRSPEGNFPDRTEVTFYSQRGRINLQGHALETAQSRGVTANAPLTALEIQTPVSAAEVARQFEALPQEERQRLSEMGRGNVPGAISYVDRFGNDITSSYNRDARSGEYTQTISVRLARQIDPTNKPGESTPRELQIDLARLNPGTHRAINGLAIGRTDSPMLNVNGVPVYSEHYEREELQSLGEKLKPFVEGMRNVDRETGLRGGTMIEIIDLSKLENAMVTSVEPKSVKVSPEILANNSDRDLSLIGAHEQVHTLDALNGNKLSSGQIAAVYNKIQKSEIGRAFFDNLNESEIAGTRIGGHASDNPAEFVASLRNSFRSDKDFGQALNNFLTKTSGGDPAKRETARLLYLEALNAYQTQLIAAGASQSSPIFSALADRIQLVESTR